MWPWDADPPRLGRDEEGPVCCSQPPQTAHHAEDALFVLRPKQSWEALVWVGWAEGAGEGRVDTTEEGEG